MSTRFNQDKLYSLLPAIYRQRDAENGRPLYGLLGVIADHAQFLEDDIEALYNNFFIETCENWVVPYIADLVGVKNLIEDDTDKTSRLRAFVANVLDYRRRKGTLSVLQDISDDLISLATKPVEFFQLLTTTQYLNHLRPQNLATADLWDVESLDLLNTPFETTSHTADVRSIRKKEGYYNMPNIGLFLWRLRAYPVKNLAYHHKNGQFSFSPFGNDMQLFSPGPYGTNGKFGLVSGGSKTQSLTCQQGSDSAYVAEEIDLPVPIRRRALQQSLKRIGNHVDLETVLQGITVYKDGKAMPLQEITVCNLEGNVDEIWNNSPPECGVAIDPFLGRLSLKDYDAETVVEVGYYYGFNGDLGAGSYPRINGIEIGSISITNEQENKNVISSAIQDWSDSNSPSGQIIEVQDSATYSEDSLAINVPANTDLEIYSTKRPIISLGSPLRVTLGADSTLTLSGLLFAGNGIEVTAGSQGMLAIEYCTMVPGGSLNTDGTPDEAGFKSLVLDSSIQTDVSIFRSIVGSIDDGGGNNDNVTIKDSIVDGTEKTAISCFILDIQNSTVFGEVNADILNASNSIFTAKVTAKRRQQGCVRFCCVSECSITPMRYECLPSKSAPNAIPQFTSHRYGDPGYGQIHKNCPKEILEGADNGAEIGAFNFKRLSNHIKNLRTALEEYSRFGTEIGIFFVT